MKQLSILDYIAIILLVVGGLNWGLVGALNFNLVSAIFVKTFYARIVYLLVGVSAVYVGAVFMKFAKK